MESECERCNGRMGEHDKKPFARITNIVRRRGRGQAAGLVTIIHAAVAQKTSVGTLGILSTIIDQITTILARSNVAFTIAGRKSCQTQGMFHHAFAGLRPVYQTLQRKFWLALVTGDYFFVENVAFRSRAFRSSNTLSDRGWKITSLHQSSFTSL